MSISLRTPLQLGSDSGGSFTDSELREAIRQNLRFLLLTRKGEYVMDPVFGVGLQDYLFETANGELLSNIKGSIRQQISIYMPYIVIEKIELSFIEEQNSLQVSILFLFNRESLPETFTLVVS